MDTMNRVKNNAKLIHRREFILRVLVAVGRDFETLTVDRAINSSSLSRCTWNGVKCKDRLAPVGCVYIHSVTSRRICPVKLYSKYTAILSVYYVYVYYNPM